MSKQKVEIVGVDTSKIKTLSSSDTIQYIKLYKETKNKDYFDKCVLGNLKLVLSCVNKYAKRGVNLDDLFQIGVIGLLKTCNNFDIDQDVKFSTYAVPLIEGEIRRYLRDSSFLRVSRQVKDLAYHYMKEKEKILYETGKIPSFEEMEKILNASSFDLKEAVESTLPLVSLNEPLYEGVDESITYEDVITTPDNHEKFMLLLSLKDGIESLEPFEKEIIIKRYYEGKSQVDLASLYNISQAQISRIEKAALIYLRKFVI